MRPDTAMRRTFKNMLEGGEIRWQTHYGAKKPYLHIDDAAEFTVRCLTSELPRKHNIALLAADDPFADLGDAVEIAAPVLGVPVRHPREYRRSPRDRMPDLAAIRELTGAVPGVKLEPGVADLARWMLASRTADGMADGTGESR